MSFGLRPLPSGTPVPTGMVPLTSAGSGPTLTPAQQALAARAQALRAAQASASQQTVMVVSQTPAPNIVVVSSLSQAQSREAQAAARSLAASAVRSGSGVPSASLLVRPGTVTLAPTHKRAGQG
jgi:hypothetical protein